MELLRNLYEGQRNKSNLRKTSSPTPTPDFFFLMSKLEKKEKKSFLSSLHLYEADFNLGVSVENER